MSEFCNPSTMQPVITLLHEKMGLDIALLGQSYRLLVETYNNGQLPHGKTVFFPVRSIKGYKSGITDNDRYGIDLPVWFENGKPVSIMILAMDPLRNMERIDGLDEPREYADINAPFSLQERRERSGYMRFVQALSPHADLYVTDIYKLFYLNGKIRSNQQMSFTGEHIHAEILKAEIEIVRPQIILAWGNAALKGLQRLFPSVHPKGSIAGKMQPYSIEGATLFVIPHPSGAARGAAKKFIKANQHGGYECAENINIDDVYRRVAVDLIINNIN